MTWGEACQIECQWALTLKKFLKDDPRTNHFDANRPSRGVGNDVILRQLKFNLNSLVCNVSLAFDRNPENHGDK